MKIDTLKRPLKRKAEPYRAIKKKISNSMHEN